MASKHAKQFNLFEEESSQKQPKPDQKIEESVKLNALQLSKNDTPKESKLKKLIDSRLKKIEKLNSLIEKDKTILSKIKDLFHKNLSKDQEKLNKEKERFIEQLIKRYGQKSFANYQRDTLEYLIEDNFDELYAQAYTSDSIENLVQQYNELKNKIHGFDDEDFEDEEDIWGEEDDFDYEEDEDFRDGLDEELEKQIVKEMLNNMGLDVDDDFFEGLNPKDSDFHERLKERLFEYSEHQKNTENAEKTRKKVITTDKEFTKLYKNLVKKIHPDLTTDETERLRREGLMKELSTVWDKRDYYQLMRLQAQIDPDYNAGMDLNKSHLKQIADELLEKIRDLEKERFLFKRESDNEFFFDNFYAKSERKMVLFIENYREQIKKERQNVSKNIQQLKSQKTTKQFLKAVNDEIEENFFDFGFY